MHARLPQAELVVVPGAGHAVQLEAPAAVAAALGGA
jgi:pimeloyl-ACP methyl ester carboxylesterase